MDPTTTTPLVLSNACGSLVVLSSERTENKEGLYSILKELRAGREADMQINNYDTRWEVLLIYM